VLFAGAFGWTSRRPCLAYQSHKSSLHGSPYFPNSGARRIDGLNADISGYNPQSFLLDRLLLGAALPSSSSDSSGTSSSSPSAAASSSNQVSSATTAGDTDGAAASTHAELPRIAAAASSQSAAASSSSSPARSPSSACTMWLDNRNFSLSTERFLSSIVFSVNSA